MNDTPNTPVNPNEEPTAAEIAAAGTIRSLDQLPSPWVVKGEPAIISEPTLEALSGPDQQTVRQQAGSNDPKAIKVALNAFLRDKQREVRIRCGAGEGATATEQEALDQMNQLRLLSKEADQIETELADVREHRTEYDANGNPVPVPVYVVQGSSRTARQARLDEIKQNMVQVAGIQGEADLQRAARTDALRIRKLSSEVAEAREIERRAHEMAREKRINEAAATKAKYLQVPRYSSREGRWYGKARSNVTMPEGTRDDRKWHTELPGGLVRVEYGAPIPRHPSETQPVPIARPSEAPPEPAPVAPAPVHAPPSPVSRKDHREHRAITREP